LGPRDFGKTFGRIKSFVNFEIPTKKWEEYADECAKIYNENIEKQGEEYANQEQFKDLREARPAFNKNNSYGGGDKKFSGGKPHFKDENKEVFNMLKSKSTTPSFADKFLNKSKPEVK